MVGQEPITPDRARELAEQHIHAANDATDPREKVKHTEAAIGYLESLLGHGYDEKTIKVWIKDAKKSIKKYQIEIYWQNVKEKKQSEQRRQGDVGSKHLPDLLMGSLSGCLGGFSGCFAGCLLLVGGVAVVLIAFLIFATNVTKDIIDEVSKTEKKQSPPKSINYGPEICILKEHCIAAIDDNSFDLVASMRKLDDKQALVTLALQGRVFYLSKGTVVDVVERYGLFYDLPAKRPKP